MVLDLYPRDKRKVGEKMGRWEDNLPVACGEEGSAKISSNGAMWRRPTYKRQPDHDSEVACKQFEKKSKFFSFLRQIFKIWKYCLIWSDLILGGYWDSVVYYTNVEVRRGGGRAGEESRQHHVQRQGHSATHVAFSDLHVLDLRRCNSVTHF